MAMLAKKLQISCNKYWNNLKEKVGAAMIETMYENFLKEIPAAANPANIDFIGMNFDNTSIFLKAYFDRKNSILDNSTIVSFLKSREMIRYYESVSESCLQYEYRVDIALKNRNNRNMKSFFFFFKKNSALFAKNERVILRLSSLKITDLPDFYYSSLYFFGYKRIGNIFHSLKFHFYTKSCQNPEYPNMGGFYQDKEYLEKLKTINIPEFYPIFPVVEKLLDTGLGHLWMIGLDIDNIGNKYKIYLKNPCDDTSLVTQVVNQTIGIDIAPAFDWLANHEEYCYTGIAICVGITGKLSVNIYFTPISSDNDTND